MVRWSSKTGFFGLWNFKSSSETTGFSKQGTPLTAGCYFCPEDERLTFFIIMGFTPHDTDETCNCFASPPARLCCLKVTAVGGSWWEVTGWSWKPKLLAWDCVCSAGKVCDVLVDVSLYTS